MNRFPRSYSYMGDGRPDHSDYTGAVVPIGYQRPGRQNIIIAVGMDLATSQAMVNAAAVRGVTPTMLVSDLLAAIARDNLFAAVLDND